MRSIRTDVRAVTADSIARIKYPQTETSWDVRSIRAVSCLVLYLGRASSPPLAVPVGGPEPYAHSKPSESPLKPQIHC